MQQALLEFKTMLTYKASYTLTEEVYLGEVLDFPGTVACGNTLDEARRNLADALLDMAETNLIRGEPLPLPDSSKTQEEADIEEPIYLLLRTGHQLQLDVLGVSR